MGFGKPIDELLRFRVFRLRHLFCQHVQHELNAFEGRVGLLGNGVDIAVVGLFQNDGIIGAHVFREDLLGLFLVGVNEINRFDESFHSVFHHVSITLNISAGRCQAVSLNLDSEVSYLEELVKAHLSRQRRA